MDCLSNCVGVSLVRRKEKILEGSGGDLSPDSILSNFCSPMLLLFVPN